jgi:methionyl aminopeptidase
MITIKTADDFAKMRHAGKVVAGILEAVRDAAAPGVTLVELDRIAAQIIHDGDCIPNFLNYHGFPANTCLSVNDELVHGIPSERALKDGDILSVDAGAIHQGWHADAAVTFPIGDVPAEAHTLMAVTERALWVGIECSTIGSRLGDLGHAISAVAAERGYGVVRGYTGHGIGLQMHEDPQVPNYGRQGKGLRLRDGMAIAIEPMFNAGSADTRVLDDGWTVVTADGSLCAHFEHTVAITPDGPEVLTLP